MSIIYDVQKQDGTRVQCFQAGQITTYVRNGRLGLLPVVLETQSGGARTTCMVHRKVLKSNNNVLRHAVQNKLPIPHFKVDNAIHYIHPQPIILQYMIDALYLDTYMEHRFLDPQGLYQAVNWNIYILHMDMFRVGRELRFHKIEEKARSLLKSSIGVLGQLTESNTVFIQALQWLYSNLNPGDWEIRRVFCFWLAHGLKSFGQPMRNDIVSAAKMIPLFKSDMEEKLNGVPAFNVPGFTL